MAEEHEKSLGEVPEVEPEGSGEVTTILFFNIRRLIVDGVVPRTLACELNFLITGDGGKPGK